MRPNGNGHSKFPAQTVSKDGLDLNYRIREAYEVLLQGEEKDSRKRYGEIINMWFSLKPRRPLSRESVDQLAILWGHFEKGIDYRVPLNTLQE